MNPDIFDDIGGYVPEPHIENYWRMVTRFRHLKPDDEILNIFLAMGILTFILRDLPTALIEEKKGWKTQIDLCHAEMGKMMEETTRRASAVNHQREVIEQAIEKGSVLLNDTALRLESVAQEVIEQIDVPDLARRFTAKLEERVVKPVNTLTLQIESQIRVIEKVGKSAETSINRLRRIHIGGIMAATSIAAFVFWGWIFDLGWDEIKKANAAALNDKLAEIEHLTSTNQHALLQLTTNNIKVEIVDVKINGETQIGKKALRLTPSLGAAEDKPDGQPPSGIIYFTVQETPLEQLLRDLRGY